MEDDQQFCLRWNNHQSTIIQNFDTLLESGTLVDCTLAAEGKYLKAHKVVLSACSPYFEGLLSEHYDKHPVFILKDVKFKELKAMMDYMYRGEVNISQDQLTALLKAAESLQIKGLSDSRTDKGTGNTGNTTTGGSKDNTRPAKTASSTAAASASAAAVDIPHSSSGLTIEKNSKVPRQSIQQVSVSDQLENSASPQLRGHSSREGSQSPTRKRKRLRRRSLGNDDNSMENHEASNSSDVNMTAPALGVAPVAAEEKNQADPADSIGRSALMQQLTKPADEMLQMPLEKPEPSEDMIQPKSEYQDDQESVEDLTHFDDDMNDLNEMEQDNSRAGPSHDPSQHGGIQPWHIAGDRSNASVVGAAAGPGAGDEVFLAAAEAAQAQRDSQDTQFKNIQHEFIDLTSDVPETKVQTNSNTNPLGSSQEISLIDVPETNVQTNSNMNRLGSSQEISLIRTQEQANDSVIESVYTLGTSEAHRMDVDANALTNMQGNIHVLQPIQNSKASKPSQHIEITGTPEQRLDTINSILEPKKNKTNSKKNEKQTKVLQLQLVVQQQPATIVVPQQPCSPKAPSSPHTVTEQRNSTLQIANNRIFFPTAHQMPIFITTSPQGNIEFSQLCRILTPPNTTSAQPSRILTPPNTISAQPSKILTLPTTASPSMILSPSNTSSPPPITIFSQPARILTPPNTAFSQSNTICLPAETSSSQSSTSTSTDESQLRKILMQPRAQHVPVRPLPQPAITKPQTPTTSSQPNVVQPLATVDLNSLVLHFRQDGTLEAQNKSSPEDSPSKKK